MGWLKSLQKNKKTNEFELEKFVVFLYKNKINNFLANGLVKNVTNQ